MIVDMHRSDLWIAVHHGLQMASESPVYANQAMDREYSLNYLTKAFDAGVLFGVVDDATRGCMIGSVSASWSSPTPQASEWMLYVEPEHRGSGLASRLVNRFAEIARQRGAQKLYVGSSTGINDEGVRKLYERLGFGSVGSALVKEL